MASLLPPGWEAESGTLFIHESGVRLERRIYRQKERWCLIPPDINQHVMEFEPTAEGRDKAFAAFANGVINARGAKRSKAGKTSTDDNPIFRPEDLSAAMTGTGWRGRLSDHIRRAFGKPYHARSIYHMREVQIGHRSRPARRNAYAKISVFLGHEDDRQTWKIAGKDELVVAFWIERGMPGGGKEDDTLDPDWDWHQFKGAALADAGSFDAVLRILREAPASLQAGRGGEWREFDAAPGGYRDLVNNQPATASQILNAVQTLAGRTDRWFSLIVSHSYDARIILDNQGRALAFIEKAIAECVPLYNLSVPDQYRLPTP